jgi:capsular exopolysaccharide synthesis family protein
MHENGHANGNGALTAAPLPSRRLGYALPLPGPPETTGSYDVFGVLARRWRVIAGTAALLVAATGLYCLLATRWYTATALVMIEARGPQLLNGQRVGEEQDAFTSAKYDYYQTQFELLRSPTLATRVITNLGLGEDPRFLPPDAPPGSVEQWKLLTQYLRQLDVLPLRGTRLVNVMFTSRDPALAAAVANQHARLFVRRGLERADKAITRIQSFLESKLAKLRGRMEAAELRLTRYQSQHHLLPVELIQGTTHERFTDLNRRLTAAEADHITLEAQHQLILSGDLDSLPAVQSSSLVQRLRGDLNRLEVDYALMARRYRGPYPPLRQLEGQLVAARELLQKETQKVADGVEAAYGAAARAVRELRKSIAAERRGLLAQRDTEGELISLTGDAQTTRALHDNLLARIKELDVAGGADASNVSIVEAATMPGLPSSPAILFDLLLALLTGLVIGSGLAFLRDSVETTVRDADDLQRATGIDILAVVPDFNDVRPPAAPRMRWYADRARVAASERLLLRGNAPRPRRPLRLPDGFGPHVEAYRTLRTSLILHPPNAGSHVLVVSSAAAREGKTTTAINVAMILARCGARVLLIDGDLRLPRCHDSLGHPVTPGLAEFLFGTAPLPPIQETKHERLSFLPAGTAVADPVELLTSWRVGLLLDQARKGFDYVVIDSPPVLAVSDSLLLASVADGVLLVTERHRTPTARVQLALARLRRAGAVVIGAVLNRGAVEAEYYRYEYSRPIVTRDDGETAVELG